MLADGGCWRTRGEIVVQEVDELADVEVVETDPLQGIRHLVKYERRRTQAERENTVVIVVTHPCDAKKMVVVWVDRAEAEGVPNVCLCEEAAAAETHDDFDGVVHGDIVEGVVLLVNAVVDAAGNWSG